MESKSSEVVFFLGAGASVKAGVPDTYSFVQEYKKSLKETETGTTIEEVVKTLKEWKGSEIDIELLLETLTKLKNREQEPLLQFFPGGEYTLKGYSEREPLIDNLKDFIKSKAIVPEEKIQYLQSLLGFIEEFRPLDIISVNYDTSIEQFCNVHKLVYQDGFDVHWNPKTFENKHTDIRLYKPHGSVMWYQSDRGRYIKLPVMTGKSKIQLITGEKAENLMLYPMQKWDYAEPLLELLIEIKHLLESEICKFLIVVGYSFRDDHIKRILWDAARKNRELHLILIDPNAYQIYFEQLKYYDDSQNNPSSLNGKVICLPYLFEKVLPYLKNHYLTNLKGGLECWNTQHREEIGGRGESASWIPCIRNFADAEYIEKVEEIKSFLQRDLFEPERDLKLSLELPLKIAVNLFAGGQEKKAEEKFKDFRNQLKKVAVERMDVNIISAHNKVSGIPQDSQIEFRFNYIRKKSSSSQNRVIELKQIIETLSKFCETRAGFVSGSENKLQKISEKLKKVKHYLESFKEDKIKFEDYIRLRENEISNFEEFKNKYKKLQGSGLKTKEQSDFEADIRETERSILKKIIYEE